MNCEISALSNRGEKTRLESIDCITRILHERSIWYMMSCMRLLKPP